MFGRRLRALGYLEWDKVNPKDEQHFRKVVLWLEEQKIRRYTIENRKQLRETNNQNWPTVFAQYCSDLQCPASKDPLEQLEWLTGHAIWLQVAEDCEGYPKKLMDKKMKNEKDGMVPTVKSTNPLDNLDFESKEFKDGTYALAKKLGVPRHPDHLVTLRACSKLVRSRLDPESLQNPSSKIIQGKPFPMADVSPPYVNLKNSGLEDAAKGLALLYIQDIRALQTKINEAIVAVQRITSNPKTDTKLGKVGR